VVLSVRAPHQNPAYTSPLPHTCYMPRPSHPRFESLRNEYWLIVECIWNMMADADAREGKWRGNWRMEWVASTLTLPQNVVYPVLLTLMRTPRLPAVDWTDAPADLNGLVMKSGLCACAITFQTHSTTNHTRVMGFFLLHNISIIRQMLSNLMLLCLKVSRLFLCLILNSFTCLW